MRLRRFLSATLLLAASAPAMADMYLFDGRAWIGGDHAEARSRTQSESASFDHWRGWMTNTMFPDRAPAIPASRDNHPGEWQLRHDPNLRPSS